MKILVVMGEYPPEEGDRRRQAVLKCASPGTEIGFEVIKATFFRRSNSQVNCLTLAANIEGKEVTTIEGLSQNGELDPVQQACLKNQAFQCGFCTPA